MAKEGLNAKQLFNIIDVDGNQDLDKVGMRLRVESCIQYMLC
jgi:hypothetical protein